MSRQKRKMMPTTLTYKYEFKTSKNTKPMPKKNNFYQNFIYYFFLNFFQFDKLTNINLNLIKKQFSC